MIKDSFVYRGKIHGISKSDGTPVPIDFDGDKTLTGSTDAGRIVVFQLSDSTLERSIFFVEDTGIQHATQIKSREKDGAGFYHMSGDDGLITTHLTVRDGEFAVMFQHRFPQ